MYQETTQQASHVHGQPFYIFDTFEWKWKAQSVVYLLHFERPICPTHPAQHYLGWTNNLYRRIEEHRAGTGARLAQVAQERGISFVVARIWPGDRDFERWLKRQKNGKRLCPLCQSPTVTVVIDDHNPIPF